MNSGSLEEQAMLLTTEPSLQPLYLVSKLELEAVPVMKGATGNSLKSVLTYPEREKVVLFPTNDFP